MERLKTGDKIYSCQFGRGEVLEVEGFGPGETVRVRFEGGEVRTLHPEQHRLELLEAEVPTRIPLQRETGSVRREEQEGEEEMVHREIRAAIKEALHELMGLGDTELEGRWTGGTLVLKPGKNETQPKEIPLDAFFHKIVMVRDQLRVLEQKINGHPKLSEEEKVALQHYVTRCYGSLTTFNVLFKAPEDRFRSS